jgi:hypothetical protein
MGKPEGERGTEEKSQMPIAVGKLVNALNVLNVLNVAKAKYFCDYLQGDGNKEHFEIHSKGQPPNEIRQSIGCITDVVGLCKKSSIFCRAHTQTDRVRSIDTQENGNNGHVHHLS